MEFHDAANIFPLDEDHIGELAEDVKANGLLCPIELLDGKVIDGRRRWMACEKAGIEPDLVEVETDDPVAYVLSLNLHRRQLTPSQRSMVAARAREFYDRAAKERQKEQAKRNQPQSQKVENLPPIEKAKARDQAGKAAGVSGKSVDYASRVIAKGTPALVKAVDEGRMAVSTAAILATEPPEVQDAEATKPKRNRRYHPTVCGGNGDEGKPKGIKPLTEAMQIATFVISHLERIRSDDPKRVAALTKVQSWIEKRRRKV